VIAREIETRRRFEVKVLLKAGLVEHEQRGTWASSASAKPLAALLDWLG
jgi:hypothetical protein